MLNFDIKNLCKKKAKNTIRTQNSLLLHKMNAQALKKKFDTKAEA